MGRGKLSNSLMLLALAAPVGLTGCSMTSTYGTGEAPEMALFREMTGGLMSKDNKEPIAYQPRAPLVMPGSADLPDPVETASVADANWPMDPDKRAIGGRVDDDDNPDNDISQEDYRRLRPLTGMFASNEAREAARTAAPNNDRDAERDAFYGFVHQSNGQRDAFSKAVADAKGFNRTSERRYLTDPPLAYREPTDTAPVGEVDTGVKKKGFWRRIMPGR